MTTLFPLKLELRTPVGTLRLVLDPQRSGRGLKALEAGKRVEGS